MQAGNGVGGNETECTLNLVYRVLLLDSWKTTLLDDEGTKSEEGGGIGRCFCSSYVGTYVSNIL